MVMPSLIGYDGTISWHITPNGPSGSGNPIVFNPGNLAPGAYDVVIEIDTLEGTLEKTITLNVRSLSLTSSRLVVDATDTSTNHLPIASSGTFIPDGDNFRLRPTAEMRNAFYLRLSVKEQPGSLGCFTSILGKHNVSIASVIQKNADEDKDGAVPVVAITHAAREADLEAALAEIATCGVVTETPVRLRILGE